MTTRRLAITDGHDRERIVASADRTGAEIEVRGLDGAAVSMATDDTSRLPSTGVYLQSEGDIHAGFELVEEKGRVTGAWFTV